MSTEGQGRAPIYMLGLATGIMITALVGAVALWLPNRSTSKPIIITPPASTPAATATVIAAPLFIDVDGAVQVPGVYQFPPGALVQDAIEAAGGLAPDADKRQVNLAQPLIGGMHIIVPVVDENDGEPPVITVPETSPDIRSGPGGVTLSGLININTANLAELEELPGIGPALAQRIIDHRIENGPFVTIEDVLNVSGIGPAKFEALEDLITVNDAP